MGLWQRVKGRLKATELPRSVWVLTNNAFLVALGFGVMIPVLPLLARSFDASNFELGMVVSAFASMRLVMSPFCGRLNALFGERNAIAIGMTIVGATSVLMGLSSSYWELLVWRGLGGLGSAMFTVGALTLLLASTPLHLRGRASGLYQGGFLLGGMAGPAVGGLLANISITAPFFFYAAMLFVAATLVMIMLRQPRAVGRGGEQTGKPFGQVVRDVRYQAALTQAFGQGWQSFGVRNALVPVVVVEVLHRDATWTGIAFAVAVVVQTLALGPVGSFVDKIGRRPVMVVSGLITGSATLAIPFAGNIWVLMGILGVYGIGSAMQGTAPTAAVGDANGGRGGTAVAVYSMSSDVGAILGPLVAGWLADRFSMPVAFAVGAAILMAGSVYAWFMPRERPPARHADPADPSIESATPVAEDG